MQPHRKNVDREEERSKACALRYSNIKRSERWKETIKSREEEAREKWKKSGVLEENWRKCFNEKQWSNGSNAAGRRSKKMHTKIWQLDFTICQSVGPQQVQAWWEGEGKTLRCPRDYGRKGIGDSKDGQLSQGILL